MGKLAHAYHLRSSLEPCFLSFAYTQSWHHAPYSTNSTIIVSTSHSLSHIWANARYSTTSRQPRYSQ